MKILKTNTNAYVVSKNEDGSLHISYLSDKSGKLIPNIGLFITSSGGVEKILGNCKEYAVVEDFYSEIAKEKEARQAHNAEMMERISAMKSERISKLNDFDRKVAEQYYQCESMNKDNGWGVVDLLIGKNELSQAMSNMLGEGYSATPYDNGAIYIKTNSGKKFVMFKRIATRKQISLSDLVSE